VSGAFPEFLAYGQATDAGRRRYRTQDLAGEGEGICTGAAQIRPLCVADGVMSAVGELNAANLGSDIQQAFSGPLIDKNGNFAFYES
jgi:hypothetical protein